MSLNDNTKLDVVFKKAKGKADTSTTTKAYYEEALGGGFLIDGGDIFAETLPDNDPAAAVAAGLATEYDIAGAIRLTEDPSVADSKGWIACTPYPGVAPTFPTRMVNWIPSKYGVTYSVRLYKNNAAVPANEIPSSDTSDWFFDEKTGVLIFQDTPPTATSFWITGYQYIGETVIDLSSMTFTNGLTETAGVVSLGGTLAVATTIDTNGLDLWIKPGLILGTDTDADTTFITFNQGYPGTNNATLSWDADWLGTTYDYMKFVAPYDINYIVGASSRKDCYLLADGGLNYNSGLKLIADGGSSALLFGWYLFKDTIVNGQQLALEYFYGPTSTTTQTMLMQTTGETEFFTTSTSTAVQGYLFDVMGNGIVAGGGTLLGSKFYVKNPTTAFHYLTGLEVEVDMDDYDLNLQNHSLGIYCHNTNSTYPATSCFSGEGAWKYGLDLDLSAGIATIRGINIAAEQTLDDSSLYGIVLSLDDSTTGLLGVSYLQGVSINLNLRDGFTQQVRGLSIANNDVAATVTRTAIWLSGTWDYAFQFSGTFTNLFNVGVNAVASTAYVFDVGSQVGGGMQIDDSASGGSSVYGVWVKNGGPFVPISLSTSAGALYAETDSATGVAGIFHNSATGGTGYATYTQTEAYGHYVTSLAAKYALDANVTGTFLVDTYGIGLTTSLTSGAAAKSADGLYIDHGVTFSHSGVTAAALRIQLSTSPAYMHHILLESDIITAPTPYRTGLITTQSYSTSNQPFCIFRGDTNATQNLLYFGGGYTGNADVATDIIFRTAPTVGVTETAGTVKEMVAIDNLTTNFTYAMSLGAEWYCTEVNTGDTLPLDMSYIRVKGTSGGGPVTLGNGVLAISVTNAKRGQILVICGSDDTDTVTIKDNSVGSGVNLAGGVDVVLGAGDTLTLIYADAFDSPITFGWTELSRSNN